MTQEIINVGDADQKQGDTPFVFCPKINRNFTELFAIKHACVVYVYELADFPTQDETTITLESDVSYHICVEISTDKTFIVQDSTIIKGQSQLITGITYTGSGTMFTSSGTWIMEDLNFSCASGTAINQSGTGTFFILRNSTCTSCLNAGFINASGLFFRGSSFTNITGAGFLFTGLNNGILFDTCNMLTQSILTIVDFGSATFFLMRILDSTMSGPVGAVSFNGLPNGANINSGNKGVFAVNDLHAGGITAMTGMSPADVRMSVSSSDGLKDSKNISDSFLVGGPETIAIAVAGDFYEIGVPSSGSWDSDINQRFTLEADGSHTFFGETDIDALIIATASIEKVGGGSNQLEVRLAKNWTAGGVGEMKTRTVTQNTTTTSLTSAGIIPLTNGDNVRVIFANNDGTSDILAEVTSMDILG